MTDRDDDGDPLLVRPYLLDEPGGTAPHASTQTWPEAAAEPVAPPEPADPTVPIPVPAPPPRGRGRRRPVLLLSAAVLVLALIGLAALVASLLPEPRRSSALPIDIPLPSRAVTAPPATTAPPGGAAPAITAATRSRAASSSPATTAPSRTAVSPSAVPAPATTGPTMEQLAPPAADKLLPPAADRIGRIHGNGDLCLDLHGALPFDGTQIQVYTCNDTSAQTWSVATDGTLRVAGKCAAAADDGAVRITGCGDRRAAQWRAGPDSSLVSLATDGCLTDPSTGARSGTAVRIEECAAAAGQRWELP